MPEVPPADVDNCGNHLSGSPKSTAHVVPSDVACHESEVWRKCIGPAAGLGLGQLPNSLGLAPQAASCDVVRGGIVGGDFQTFSASVGEEIESKSCGRVENRLE